MNSTSTQTPAAGGRTDEYGHEQYPTGTKPVKRIYQVEKPVVGQCLLGFTSDGTVVTSPIVNICGNRVETLNIIYELVGEERK